MLSPSAIRDAGTHALDDLVRSCGFAKAKSGCLQTVAAWYERRDLSASELPTDPLREELLGLRGIGPETADILLLYVYERPVFVFDAYARRLLAAAEPGDYPAQEDARMALAPAIAESGPSVAQLGAFHALIPEAGKRERKLGGWPRAYGKLMSGDFRLL